MKNSPLCLEKSFFTKVSILANPDGKADARWEVEAVPEITMSGGDRRKWVILLRISLRPVGDAKLTYSVEVQIVGQFSVVPAWPEEKIDMLVHANGSGLLYSSAREMICNVTARGPWPMIFLPAVSFVDNAKTTGKK
jgi:preprotein translocase subunit SecB